MRNGSVEPLPRIDEVRSVHLPGSHRNDGPLQIAARQTGTNNRRDIRDRIGHRPPLRTSWRAVGSGRKFQPEKAGRAADSLKAHGTAAQSYVADVRRAADVELLIRNVESDMGPIDIVINSAGVWFPTPLGQTPAQKIDDMIDINLKGSIWVVAAVAPGMIKRRSGRIVNIASVAALVPTPILIFTLRQKLRLLHSPKLRRSTWQVTTWR